MSPTSPNRESQVHADAGYTGPGKRWQIAVKRGKRKGLAEGLERVAFKASVRAFVEHSLCAGFSLIPFRV